MKAKYTLILLLLFLSSNFLFSQDFHLKITLLDNNSRPNPNVKAWITNTDNGKVLNGVTDRSGIVQFALDPGKWALSFDGLPDYEEYDVPENAIGNATVQLVYDLDDILLEQDFFTRRNGIQFTDTDQKNIQERGPATNFLSVNNFVSYWFIIIFIVLCVHNLESCVTWGFHL